MQTAKADFIVVSSGSGPDAARPAGAAPRRPLRLGRRSGPRGSCAVRATMLEVNVGTMTRRTEGRARTQIRGDKPRLGWLGILPGRPRRLSFAGRPRKTDG